jgi:hypothetical protein
MEFYVIKVMQLPYVPDEVFEIMHEFSVFLLKDDKHDLGYYRYYKRKGHYYMGRPAPDHPGMLHHWQIGMAGLIMAQLGGLINLARNAIANPAESMEESELYDESTVIDLPESSVSESETAPPVPTPSLLMQEQEETQEYILQEEQEQPKPTISLQTLPSLPPLAKL